MDDALTLSEILLSRRKVITEQELWALCRECALTLEYVQNQSDIYEGLCITPDTVAFDQTGSVCFLDLGTEPDSFFLPPEYENGNLSKVQLFSLGMTLLYAVDHDDDPDHKPTLSQHFTDLLSQLTADEETLRPTLETVIAQCEQVLAGQSSQDICLHFSTLAPSPDPQEGDSSILDLTSGLTAYLQSQTGIVNQSPELESPEADRDLMNSRNSKDSEMSYLDKNQNVKQVKSNHSGNVDSRTSEHRTGNYMSPVHSSEGSPRRSSDHRTSASRVHSNPGSVHSSREGPLLDSSVRERNGKHGPSSDGSKHKSSRDGSNRTSSGSSRGSSRGSNKGSSRDSVGPAGDSHGSSVPNSPSKRKLSLKEENLQNGCLSSPENQASTPSSGLEQNQMLASPSKEAKKKPSVTISDIIELLDRYLQEKELWALCREGVLALQRKKRHLPAYISPDTVVVRGDGSVTFKAIPEDKPLEVIFMAPELQQKGVLSEKTCLYGLGISLRCAAGQKYSTSLSLQVSQRFEALLLALLQPSPEKRPSLHDTLQLCDDHETEGHPPSKISCLELYDTAANIKNSSSNHQGSSSLHSTPVKNKPQKNQSPSLLPPAPPSFPPPAPPGDDDEEVSEEELNLAYVPEEVEEDLGYDNMEDDQDEHGQDEYEESFVDEQDFTNSSPMGFKPLTKSASNSISGSPSSAFKPVSFKPVPSSLTDGVRVPSAFSSQATHFKPIVLHGHQSGAQSSDNKSDFDIKKKEKEVMRKLKELETELSKPRKVEPVHEKNQKESSSQEGVNSNPLESLLNQLQSQGQMPNTQSLASAIAQHLKSQSGPTTSPEANSVSPPQVHQPLLVGQQVPVQQMVPQAPYPAMMNPGQTYPLPSHGVLEQSHSFPLQYGGMIPSYPPLQMQLQQDPRTGLMSWVPMLPYQSPPGSVALGSSLPVSPEFYRNSSSNPSQNFSGYSSDAHSNPNRSDVSESVNNEEMNTSPFRSRGPSSASSTKSAQEHSSPHRVPVTQSPSDGYTSESASLRRPQSDHHANHSPMRERHSVSHLPAHDHRGHLTNESRSSPHIRHFQSSMKQLSVPSVQGGHQDQQDATSPQRLTNQSVAGAPQDDPSVSQTSSPSPSKDSGVSGVQAPVRTYPYPSSDASLMERLLSPESIHRQRVQGRVLQLVREEQGFDMLFEQNAEDCAMAEYITSLGNLKWETFVSAITEKYSELYWGNQLLGRLYDTINSHPSALDQQNSSKDRTPPPPPARYSSYVVTENLTRERSENRDWSESASHQNEAQNVSHKPRHTENMYVKHNGNSDRRDPRFSDRTNRYSEQGDRKTFSLPNKPKIVTNSAFSPRGSENQRSQSACPRFIGSSTISETSDSTDTEMREKKRRYKKRYELDRAKSSSMHNLSSGAMFTVPETRRSDSYLVSSHTDTDFLSQGETTPVNCSTPHQTDDHHTDYPDSLPYHQNNYNERGIKLQGDRPHLPQHSHSIQERYSVQPNRPPPRKTVSLSPTPLPNYSSNWAAPMEEYKYNSLPRDAFKRQKPSPVEHRASYSFQQFDSSRQPVLDRKQEIPHRVGQNRDQLNSSVSNKVSLGSKSSESDSETNFRDNVRRTTAKIMQQNSDRSYKDDNRNSYRGNGNVREKVSQVKQQKESQPKPRGSSLSSLPTEGSVRPSDPTNRQTVPVYIKTDQVVYHWAAIQLNMSSDVEAFIQEIEQEEDNKSLLERRLTAVNQQLSVQKKERKTSQKFYRKLTEPTFRSEKGVDQKTSQVLKNLSEMTKKIRFLELCKAHLQMLLSELHGLDPSYLYSLLALQENRPLVLQPYTDNPTLQFQGVREPHTGCEVQVLHAGEPKGLMAYLFTASALSDGYIHQFLYTFRYFLAPEQLLDFIRTRYIAASRSSQSDSNVSRVMNRAVDLLQFWIEGFFTVDFERNLPLIQRLEAFVREYVSPACPDSASSLRHLIQVCRHGPPSELLGDTIGGEGEEDRNTCFVHLETSKKKSRAEMIEEWDSFRSSTKVKVTPKHRPSLPDLSVDLEKFRMARSMLDITMTTTLTTRGRADSFSILDYSVNNLAEQLTLMEQDLFVMTHPVHYLNSKAHGVGVAMSMPGMRTPSMQRKNREPEVTSLFVSDAKMESVIQRIISYNQELSHWVAAEIVTCTSSKTQCAVMTAFIQLAQLCGEIRNFSTCLAILDGLENLIVRQLPAWKNLSSKCGDIMEDLAKIKVHIKGEQNYLMKDKDSHLCPTMPSVLYFLLHVQQLEIGSFKLANEMYKWTKMRSISKTIDQIRIFRENEYLFEPDETLQDAIQQRILDFSDQDLHSIASTNETNFRKFSGGGLSGVFKKVKGKLQSKGEK